jgi:hypothetical protein
VAYFAVRLLMIFSVPMVEAPDEFAHYWVIRTIAATHALPDASSVAAGGPSAVYGSLPPLGYVVHIVVSLPVSAAWVSLSERFGSLFIGLLMLFAAFRLGGRLFPHDRGLQICLPALVTFHPQLVFVQSYANNDATASALASLIILLVVGAIQDSLSVSSCALVGALVGWLALSKYSGLSLLPVVAVALVGAAVIHKTPVKRAIICLSVSGVCAVAVSAWWFVRNYFVFGGDWLGTATMYKSWALTFHRDVNTHFSVINIVKQPEWWRMLFASFFAVFGYMTKYVYSAVYVTYFCFLAAAVAGWSMRVRGGSIPRPGEPESTTRPEEPGSTARSEKQDRFVWFCLALIVAINLAAVVYASTTNLGGPQGRYLFISELPVMALVLSGLRRVGSLSGKYLPYLFTAVNAAVCIGCCLWLAQLYGFRARPF